MKILSLAPSNTEILYALGLGDQIIGTTSHCDYPNDAKTKQKIGSWITQTADQIKSLKPDLIFTCYFLPAELSNWKGPGEIVHIEPRTLEDIYLSIITIGHKTGTKEKAERIIAKMKADIAELKAKNKDLKGKKMRVYMEEWPKPPMVSGNWVPELVRIAGGLPIIAKKGQPSGEFPFPILERENPDVMIFHWCGFGKRFNKQMVLARPGWSELKAVKNDKIFVIDDSLINRPGPRIVEGIRSIQEILHKI